MNCALEENQSGASHPNMHPTVDNTSYVDLHFSPENMAVNSLTKSYLTYSENKICISFMRNGLYYVFYSQNNHLKASSNLVHVIFTPLILHLGVHKHYRNNQNSKN